MLSKEQVKGKESDKSAMVDPVSTNIAQEEQSMHN